MKKLPEYFGSLVFGPTVMRERLPAETYNSLMRTINEGKDLDIEVANVVANAMKEWAIEHGVTHYTHWFQPMTGITAEKHDSFISPTPDGKVIMEFSGKQLVRGEPDASSFPSGGLRATFEARGYTAWDPTSYAFIKGNTLCIPTAFCSYGGHALDKKTPLLRSMEALNKQALRILTLFGHTEVSYVYPTVGAEQEYFLIDREMYNKRPDLIFTGRTLFGAPPPKGQELGDHYFGSIKPRVAAFMEDLNEELWKLGILAKTEHNEVAPSQHELAPIHTTVNVATDHNQLTMEIMKQVALRHGLVCLLHEKPFAGVNGSGKHNNWSLNTNTGVNLLSPGETPYENAQFLLFLVAVVKAVDDYQDLLRVSVATASNDLRLGGNEAPPAIISVYLGSELTAILESIELGIPYNATIKGKIQLGTSVLPPLPLDTTDRNRTSPFAFTGNKFEFRMLGSSDSIACANIMLNTAVAESLRQFADVLEGASDFKAALNDLIRDTFSKHKRIIFNGNGYDDAWVKEAVENRGLLNLKTTPDCMPYLISKKNLDMLVSHNVYSSEELHSRYEILLTNYCKVIKIEALTMLDMTRRHILPAIGAYVSEIASMAAAKMAVSGNIDCSYEKSLLERLSALMSIISSRAEELEEKVNKVHGIQDVTEQSYGYRDLVIPKMSELRAAVDEAELITAEKHWPFPSYGDLLYSVR